MANKKSTTNVPSSSAPTKKAATTGKTQNVQNQAKANPALLNAKHHQPSAKKQVNTGNQRDHSPDRKQNANPTGTTAPKSSLMELLFAASEKHKTQQKEPKEQPSQQRTRKQTAPSVISSSAYAGAAFDRAPTGESFPVPSFLSKTSVGDDDSVLSASCPLPAGPMTSRVMNSTNASPLTVKAETKPVLKSVSIQDLLSSNSQPSTPSKQPQQQQQRSSSPSPPSKTINVANQSGAKQQNLNSLTQDLRRMLNISK